MAKRKVGINWAMQPRQLEFIRACGLGYPFDRGAGPTTPVARMILYGGSAGGGKDLAIFTSIPTPDGFTDMGSLEPGDTVIGGDLEPTTVLAVSEVMHNPCYELEFWGGSKIVAGADHDWPVEHGCTVTLKRTEEIYNTYYANGNKKPLRVVGSMDITDRCIRSYIVNVKPVETVPTKCIKVSAESGIFLIGEEMIPTHNSDSLLMTALLSCITWPGCNVGYFRRRYPDLEGPGGAIMRSHELFKDLAKYHGGNRRWNVVNGGVVQFCHCQNEDDVYSYNSQQFDILLIDESTQFSEFQIKYLQSRNRATVSNLIPFCAMATNPGGVSHGFHLKKFVEAGPPGVPVEVEIEPGRFQKHLFIPARLADNQVLEDRDPGYRTTLMNMPEEMRRALLDGDWYVFKGQYFKDFSVDKHVVEPFVIPNHWRKFGSMDWGFAAPCAVHLHTIDPAMGRIYTYKELYVTEQRAGDVAKMVKEMVGTDEIEYFKISPDAFHERGLGSKATPGEVVAEEFKKVGLNVEPADNRRVLGWQRMREYMSDAPDGKPWWQIFDNCYDLIRTLPTLIHDRTKVEDVSGDCEDHAPESCLVGETLIDTTSGQIPIKDMVGKKYNVFCYDEGKKEMVISEAYDIRMTQKGAKVYEIETDDGRMVKATGDHMVLTRDGWKAVASLSVGDDIVDVNRWLTLSER